MSRGSLTHTTVFTRGKPWRPPPSKLESRYISCLPQEDAIFRANEMLEKTSYSCRRAIFFITGTSWSSSTCMLESASALELKKKITTWVWNDGKRRGGSKFVGSEGEIGLGLGSTAASIMAAVVSKSHVGALAPQTPLVSFFLIQGIPQKNSLAGISQKTELEESLHYFFLVLVTWFVLICWIGGTFQSEGHVEHEFVLLSSMSSLSSPYKLQFKKKQRSASWKRGEMGTKYDIELRPRDHFQQLVHLLVHGELWMLERSAGN